MAVILVVIINAAFVWLPLLLHLVAPGLTTQRLTAFNGWLRANGNKILIVVLLVAGAFMVGNGIFGLAGAEQAAPVPARPSPRPAARCSGAPRTPQSRAVCGSGPGAPGR